MRFIHAADLHLGLRVTRFDPVTAGKIREARFTALDNLLKRTRERDVDFALIAGDLFDDAAVDRQTADRAFELLNSFPVPVYVLPGNHDPLVAGGVWDRPPWDQPRGQRVRLLREESPLEIAGGAVIYPCPVLRRTSLDDPTAWIAQAPRADGTIRIGLAHGSLRIRDDLPADDHLIARFAADDLHLDYLALGHWHSRRLFANRERVERTAYSGVHEPMRFQGSLDSQTGWMPYSGGRREEFLDAGKGEVLQVNLRASGEPPVIEPVEVGHYIWQEEQRQLASKDDLDRLIQEVATCDALERRLLRLRLAGVLDAENMLRLDVLREILTNRYLLGELDTAELHVRPTEEEMREAACQGVLRRVLDQLQVEAAAPEATVRQVAERAILLLYQIAKEVER